MTEITLGLLLACIAPLGSTQETPGPGGSSPSVEVRVQPEEVTVGMFYNGAEVSVEALAPEATWYSLTIEGVAEKLDLKRKGKVFGLIWMNVGDVVFDDVPELYLQSTSGPWGEFSPLPGLEGVERGYQDLARRAGGSGAGEEATELFRELVRLKERDGLWGIDEGGLEMRPAGDGRVAIVGRFHLPAKAPPGEYRVQLVAFSLGEGSSRGESGVLMDGQLRVVRSGPVELITSLALQHGLLYGILAVVVAMATGLLTGVLFGAGSRKGH